MNRLEASPGTEARGFGTRGLFSGRADSRLRACLLMKVRGGQRQRVCQNVPKRVHKNGREW
jgi:hypothetical protein